MDEQNRSDHATNVTEVDVNVIGKGDIVERLRDYACLGGYECLCDSCALHAEAADEIERLRQKEQDILAGIQLVVKSSNAGRDKEIDRLNNELDAISLALDETKQDTIYSVASKMAALILRLPCECEEDNDKTINKYCGVCSAYNDWEKVMSHVK